MLLAQAVVPDLLSSSDGTGDRESRWASAAARPAVTVGERSSAWLKLQAGETAATVFRGGEATIADLQGNGTTPAGQVAADINADGYADLISGFRTAAGGGVIALHRASKEAFEPTDAQVLADLRRGIFPASFEAEATVHSVPVAPDFIFAGKFSKDSMLDLVFAARGGRSVYLMTGDGKGGFNAPQEVVVDGVITALASAQFDGAKAFAGLVVGIRDGNASNVLVFDGATELQHATPRRIQMSGEVSALLLARAGGHSQDEDLFGLNDGSLFTVRRIADSSTAVERIPTPSKGVDLAVGEFIRDRDARAEIAVLSQDGSVSYLTRGRLDTRPFTPDEVLDNWSRNGGRGRSASASETATISLSDAWLVAESHQVGASARRLQKAYLTGNETEDLLVTDSQSNRVRVFFKEPGVGNDRASFTGETKVQDVTLGAAPAAVVPMRLNLMGQQGFVFFARGSVEPIPVVTVPNATFVVTKTADTNDGACNADCSLREAVRAANAAAGSDMITIPNGTYTLTIAGGSEDLAATGDLDITGAVVVVGGGAATTIVQAGTSTGTGIDKVFSVNPSLGASFATSFSNLTMRFGNNTTDGFGGAMDWDAGPSGGTITIDNVVVTNNTLNSGGLGGGGLLFSSAVNPGGGSVTDHQLNHLE